MTGKKFAPRAATRNLVRRLAREAFRVRRNDFGGWDILLRLSTRFDKAAYPSAVSGPLRALVRAEIDTLLDKAAREIVRREESAAATEPAPERPESGPASGAQDDRSSGRP